MDGDLLALLKDLERDGHLNKTLLILMADHGARFNHIRAIPQGKLEERNPYFALRFPPWFLEKYPGVAKNLKINSRRLTTPFDIYATLSDLLNFTTAGEETSADRSSSKVAVSRGMSLLREIPKERRCSEAGVTPHWCACLDWKHVNQSEDKFVAAAVQASLEKINSITQEKRDMCAVLELREITRSLRYVPTASDIAAEGKMEDFEGSEPMKAGLLKDKFLPPLLGSKRKLYQVSFITAPGQGHFEVTCTLDVNTGKIQINTNDISRMNQYGSAPSCLKDAHPQMNPFCYCK
ncbi:hypothetical protein BaRGS_00012960 [Batillaria attramentaria]|uniref:Sulfatase N-terminal domain-containing protein n=1 Tax=Batillaria attramentaria TaxID=370345 RepID=A0ABD0L8R5_9CAEN